MTEERKLADGYHWVDHPVHGTIIIKVEKGLIYQMATVATRMSNDKKFNDMAHVKVEPYNFKYNDAPGWF